MTPALYQRLEPRIGTWLFPCPPDMTVLQLYREQLLCKAWARKHGYRPGFRMTSIQLTDRTIIIATKPRRTRKRTAAP